MNFTSLFYLPFFALTVALYRRFPVRFRPVMLLIASCWFFALGSPGSMIILLAVTAVTYAAGLGMGHCDQEHSALRRGMLAAALILTLGCLAVFKYTSWFFLPAGISFYTFQALSYCIDVYREKYPAEKDFFRYALFVAFFPQVVAGPIERPADLIPQLDGQAEASSSDFRTGGFLLLRGYAKKIIMADGIAPAVDAFFSSAGSLAGPQVMASAILFAFQIYTDFSGYSDIACGSARFLGIRLHENFQQPYLSSGIRDFWRRWHITLTRWFTDYLYIPLGGNRRGKLITARNTLIVFAVSGLWHGRGWHFILWGVAFGLLMILEDFLHHEPGRFLTFTLVCLLWILFRAPDIRTAVLMYSSIPFGWEHLPAFLVSAVTAGREMTLRFFVIFPLLYLLKKEPEEGSGAPKIQTLLGGYVLFVMIIVCLFLNLQNGTDTPFLYFQF